MPTLRLTGFLLKKSNGTKNITFTQGPSSLLMNLSLDCLVLFLVLLSTKEL